MSSNLLRSPLAGDAAFRAALRAWYRRARRPLPWRRTRDPYRIWVSEVMLQQTRVAAATPYYLDFLRRFPTLKSLAAARPEAVLAAWSGLGYYRRARSLHAAARLVASDHAGRVPSDPDTFGRLPGVGPYTAGAVLSIAFDRRLPALDGNVARVLSRLHAVHASARDPRGASKLRALAASLLPMRGIGSWNQALMELGARICVSTAPRCGICPIRKSCRAHRQGRVSQFPPRPPRRAPERQRRAVALVESRGRWLLVRQAGPLLEGLWEPPGVVLGPGEDSGARLRSELRRLGVRTRLEPTPLRVRHAITHRTIEVEVWRGGARLRTRRPELTWWPGGDWIGLTGLARKLLVGRA